MSARKQTDDQMFDHLVLPNDDLGDLGLQRFETRGERLYCFDVVHLPRRFNCLLWGHAFLWWLSVICLLKPAFPEDFVVQLRNPILVFLVLLEIRRERF